MPSGIEYPYCPIHQRWHICEPPANIFVMPATNPRTKDETTKMCNCGYSDLLPIHSVGCHKYEYKVEPLTANIKPCGKCGGTGRITNGFNYKCPTCKGQGTIPSDTGTVTNSDLLIGLSEPQPPQLQPSDTPMGVSAWIEHGKRYGYYNFAKDKEIAEAFELGRIAEAKVCQEAGRHDMAKSNREAVEAARKDYWLMNHDVLRDLDGPLTIQQAIDANSQAYEILSGVSIDKVFADNQALKANNGEQ